MADELPIAGNDGTDPPLPLPGGDSAPASQPTESPVPVRSVRDELLAARDKVAAEADKPAATVTDDRPRDATGKFLSKAALDAAVKPVSGKPAEAKPATAVTEQQTSSPASVPSGPPPGWSAEAKTDWAKVSPAIQAAVIKREAEVNAGFAEYKGIKQKTEEYERVFAPRRHIYANEGISDAQAADNMWQWYERLSTRDPQAWHALAQQFGFDLSTVISAADPGTDPQQVQVHPAVMRELEALRAQVGQVSGTIEQQNQARAGAHLREFAASPGHEHFDRVKVDMGHYLSRLPPSTPITTAILQDAYDRCVWSNPDTRKELTAAEIAKATAAAATNAIRTPPNPRRAAVSVRGGSPNGAGQPQKPAGSVRDMLKAGFAEQRGG